jgi:truncated hemoglobin YjbI
MRHAPFRIDETAHANWMRNMRDALSETALPDHVRVALDAFLDDVAGFLRNA